MLVLQISSISANTTLMLIASCWLSRSLWAEFVQTLTKTISKLGRNATLTPVSSRTPQSPPLIYFVIRNRFSACHRFCSAGKGKLIQNQRIFLLLASFNYRSPFFDGRGALAAFYVSLTLDPSLGSSLKFFLLNH